MKSFETPPASPGPWVISLSFGLSPAIVGERIVKTDCGMNEVCGIMRRESQSVMPGSCGDDAVFPRHRVGFGTQFHLQPNPLANHTQIEGQNPAAEPFHQFLDLLCQPSFPVALRELFESVEQFCDD